MQLAYIISDHENPTNHPIYAVDEDIGSCILHINDDEKNYMICVNRTVNK